jgi:HD-like signal output (HDOD) protein
MEQSRDNQPNAASSPEVATFVGDLKRELAQGHVDLPSFPDASLQIQRLLSDDNVSMEKVVRIVGVEPVLAGHIMQLANSAALNPRGAPILELRTAVARLGFDSLRAAAVSFAMTQLRVAAGYKGILQPLTLLWKDNVTMASTACVVARRCRRISPDTALFAGLVSGVGKICLLARASRSRLLIDNPAAYNEVVRDWHAEVAQVLLRSWNVADDIVSAIHNFQQKVATVRGTSPLADVLSVAGIMSIQQQTPEQLAEALQTDQSAARLGLDPRQCVTFIGESESELAVLQAALGQ